MYHHNILNYHHNISLTTQDKTASVSHPYNIDLVKSASCHHSSIHVHLDAEIENIFFNHVAM